MDLLLEYGCGVEEPVPTGILETPVPIIEDEAVAGGAGQFVTVMQVVVPLSVIVYVLMQVVQDAGSAAVT